VWVPFWLCGACVCLFGLSARVCAFLVGGRVCVPFGLVGTACVCLFDLLEQLVGLLCYRGKGACLCLFGLLTRVCVCLVCGNSRWAFLALRVRARVCPLLAGWRVCVPFWLVGACVCLLGLLARVSGLLAPVCAFLTCWSSW